jgi:Concanavalin A-like lectin/glucanases superfamily/Domain of unknown function (DUF2341)
MVTASLKRSFSPLLLAGVFLIASCSDADKQIDAPMNTSGGSASAGGSSAISSGGSSSLTTGGATSSGGSNDATGGSGGLPVGSMASWEVVMDTSASGANVTDSVQNYPLAVTLTSDNFDFSLASADGSDLRFSRDGTPLAHEIELWDAEAKMALIWVKVAEILGDTAEQTIEMRVGKDAGIAGSDGKSVFNLADGFYGVWHLGEDGNTAPGGYADSSEHEGHATGVAMIPGSSVSARLGRGIDLDNPEGQNTARYVQVTGEKASAYNPDGPLTVSVWALAHSYPIYSYETILSKGDTSWSLQRVTYDPNQGYQSCLLAGDDTTYHFCIYDFAKQPLVTEEWLHFQLVLDEPTMTLYINGQLNAQGTGSSWNQGDHPLGIGNQTQFNGRRQWDGTLDEVRVMRAARSASWARLDYESQKASQTLVTLRPLP